MVNWYVRKLSWKNFLPLRAPLEATAHFLNHVLHKILAFSEKTRIRSTLTACQSKTTILPSHHPPITSSSRHTIYPPCTLSSQDLIHPTGTLSSQHTLLTNSSQHALSSWHTILPAYYPPVTVSSQHTILPVHFPPGTRSSRHMILPAHDPPSTQTCWHMILPAHYRPGTRSSRHTILPAHDPPGTWSSRHTIYPPCTLSSQDPIHPPGTLSSRHTFDWYWCYNFAQESYINDSIFVFKKLFIEIDEVPNWTKNVGNVIGGHGHREHTTSSKRGRLESFTTVVQARLWLITLLEKVAWSRLLCSICS